MKQLKDTIFEKLIINKNSKPKDWKPKLIDDINKIYANNKAYLTEVKEIINKFINTNEYKITNKEYVIIAHDYYKSKFCKKYNCEGYIYKFLNEKNLQEFNQVFDDNKFEYKENWDNERCYMEVLIEGGYLAINGNLSNLTDNSSFMSILLVPKFEVDNLLKL